MSFVLGIDEWEYGVVSDCCNAGMYINGICSDCKDHCVPIEDEEDEEDGIAGNERESNTAGKSPNPYQLAGRDISGQRPSGGTMNNNRNNNNGPLHGQTNPKRMNSH